VRQTDSQAVVKITWNESCLQPQDPKVTRQAQKKSKWNPQKRCMENKRCTERRFISFDKVEYIMIYMCIVVSIDNMNVQQKKRLKCHPRVKPTQKPLEKDNRATKKVKNVQKLCL